MNIGSTVRLMNPAPSIEVNDDYKGDQSENWYDHHEPDVQYQPCFESAVIFKREHELKVSNERNNVEEILDG